MTSTTKYLALAILFCLAVLCFMVGTIAGAIAFIAIGFLLELAFWIGVFKTSSKPKKNKR
ncbi:hypothetical protein QTP81_17040 [Alteromonas sp. ASW11-36]|uniref:Phosphatidate cytidylyltransferase n=1 Tax=Alteromonas arenosi TaxID=3055817 RepID=A0ABT7T1J3_9ALTE|nr:hypothetical protein [Alteromonas sp. ASW11-36]MDM7862316.1 hypothetical protein [Alteromonas sp. ASW11-36]